MTCPAAAEGSVGVGIQENPVSLQKAAKAGQTYTLPAVHFANTGTQDESIRLRVERISDGKGRVVPATWIQFGSTQIQLSPHQETKVSIHLVVPDTARTGSYLSDIVAIGSAVVPSKAADFRPAAATKLEFRVVPGPSPGLFASVPRPLRVVILIVLLALLLYIGNRYFTRNFTVSVRRKKKPDGDVADNLDGTGGSRGANV
ncbi:MAG: hypothetical protein ACTHJW_01850 [Streptosporangiaceae bacterium]